MTMPMILGLLVSSTVIGRIITSTGRWKRVPGRRLGAAHRRLRADGHAARRHRLLAARRLHVLIGVGVGMTMQNLVLAVQNTVGPHELGAASSVVAFFRSLGGAIGVSVLGAVLGPQGQGLHRRRAGRSSASRPPARAAAAPCRTCTPCPARSARWWRARTATAPATSSWPPPRSALIALIAVLFIKEVPLRRHNGDPVSAEVERESTVAAGGWRTPWSAPASEGGDP